MEKKSESVTLFEDDSCADADLSDGSIGVVENINPKLKHHSSDCSTLIEMSCEFNSRDLDEVLNLVNK